MSSFIHPHVNLKTDSFFCRTQEDILKNVSIVFVMLEVRLTMKVSGVQCCLFSSVPQNTFVLQKTEMLGMS